MAIDANDIGEDVEALTVVVEVVVDDFIEEVGHVGNGAASTGHTTHFGGPFIGGLVRKNVLEWNVGNETEERGVWGWKDFSGWAPKRRGEGPRGQHPTKHHAHTTHATPTYAAVVILRKHSSNAQDEDDKADLSEHVDGGNTQIKVECVGPPFRSTTSAWKKAFPPRILPNTPT